MMLEGVANSRIQAMTQQELRWLDNAKKAFAKSDTAFQSGVPEDDCLEALCKAVDTAKTLHRSLLDEPHTVANNAKEFIDFIHLEIPRPEHNGLCLELVHSRTGKELVYGFGKLVYEVRCMIHENENLNADEDVDFHILIDWKTVHGKTIAWISGDHVVVSGHLLWERLRQVLAKFLTIVESTHMFPTTGRREASVAPPLGSVLPKRGKTT